MKFTILLIFALIGFAFGDSSRRWLLDKIKETGQAIVDLPTKAIELGTDFFKDVLDKHVEITEAGVNIAKNILNLPVNMVNFGGSVVRGAINVPFSALKLGSKFIEELNNRPKPMFFTGQKVKVKDNRYSNTQFIEAILIL